VDGVLAAFAERVKFSAYCIFILLWATLVYDPATLEAAMGMSR